MEGIGAEHFSGEGLMAYSDLTVIIGKVSREGRKEKIVRMWPFIHWTLLRVTLGKDDPL